MFIVIISVFIFHKDRLFFLETPPESEAGASPGGVAAYQPSPLSNPGEWSPINPSPYNQSTPAERLFREYSCILADAA
jgi:hypothetical protein